MASRLFIFVFISLFVLIAMAEEDEVYIVYMGGKGSSNPGTLRDDQARLLNYVSLSKRNAVVHVYKHAFTGFAVHLSKEEANLLAQEPGVVSVFPDKMMKLQTTRSWSFLQHQNYLDNSIATSPSGSTANGADTIIGVIDTGVWPESKSFSDEGMGLQVPKEWKGTCEATEDFPASSCNRKLIGARNHVKENQTCRDFAGHGSHTASIASGASVAGVSYYGLASGTAIGGLPTSRLAVYKACHLGGCPRASILEAMDAAVNDGVDIISISIGESGTDLWNDVVAIGGFHATEHGISVVAAAGNSGPRISSVVNYAPWMTTVAASSIDRQFYASVVLGTNQVIKGVAIQFSGLSESPTYPLIDGVSAKIIGSQDHLARSCESAGLDPTKVRGRIVLCFNDEEFYPFINVEEIENIGGIGVILASDDWVFQADTQYPNKSFPRTSVSSVDGDAILEYIKSDKNPTATILKSETSLDYKPASIVASFSSRGPSTLTQNILKPDITAPGVNIIAAWSKSEEYALPGQDLPDYIITSGTSMSCPHISGVAALVKSQHPTWDPSAIRSAIMTTAIQINSEQAPITKLPGLQKATPYDFGAGLVNIGQVTNPGLIYVTPTIDYYTFLCHLGYTSSKIMLIAKTIPDGFSCPKDANEDLISNMNYPSIAVANFKPDVHRKVTRTVTNVGDEDETVYTVTVDSPEHLNVQVIPEKLQFTKDKKELSFEVNFSSQYPYWNDVFGWITWSDGRYRVRSPFVLTINF